MKKLLLMVAIIASTFGAFAKDIKVVKVTTTPQMHCVSCENRIKNNIRFEKGVKKIETNIPQQTVIITYDADKTTVENILKGFTKFKYTARVLKNNEIPTTNSSEECQNM